MEAAAEGHRPQVPLCGGGDVGSSTQPASQGADHRGTPGDFVQTHTLSQEASVQFWVSTEPQMLGCRAPEGAAGHGRKSEFAAIRVNGGQLYQNAGECVGRRMTSRSSLVQ